MQSIPKLVRIHSVLEQTGLGKTSIYELIKGGFFPAPLKIGKRAVAWRQEQLDDWLSSRPLGGGKTAGVRHEPN